MIDVREEAKKDRGCTPETPCHADNCIFCNPEEVLSRLEIERTGKERIKAALRAEVHQQRIRREARRILDAEERPPAAMPEILTLAERLSRPRPPISYRITGWQPTGARVMLAAQFKAGKTTLVGNLVRSLVDADDFLDTATVEPVAGKVAILDFEMSAHQLDGWLEDQNIREQDKVLPIPMRGNAAAFDILDPAVRARWAALLTQHQVTYLILDCLRPVLDALGLDEHRDAGRFLVAFDALLAEAGITEAAIVHHMGHNGERSRGDSRIRDWPDVEWRLVRQDDEPSSPRYLSAYGRDVDQPESALSFDPTSRHLTLAGGSRKEAAARAALTAVLAVIEAEPGLSGRAIEDRLTDSDHSQKAVREGIKIGRREGLIRVEEGPRNSKMHFSASVRQSASPVRQRGRVECVSASIDDALTHTLPDPVSASPDADHTNPSHGTGTDAPFAARCSICQTRRLLTPESIEHGICHLCRRGLTKYVETPAA